MAKFLTLQEWCDANYSSRPPPMTTLWRRARTGCIILPQKNTAEPTVFVPMLYINPKSYRLARDLHHASDDCTPLLECIKNG